MKNRILRALFLVSVAAVAAPVPEPVPSRPPDSALRAWADAAWTRVMATFYSPKTGNIYTTTPDKVSPAKDFPGGLLKPGLGYGRGLEDCAINGGVALSGLVDKWLATRDASVSADAEKVARGLLNLETASTKSPTRRLPLRPSRPSSETTWP